MSAEVLEAVEAAPMHPAVAEAEIPVTAEQVAEASSPAEASAAERADAAPEAPAAQGAPAEALATTPPAEPVAVVLSPPSDPNRPKRAGWWSRTKAALTGE